MGKKTGQGAVKFKFYDKLDDILGEKPTMACTHAIDTSDLDDTSNSTNASTNDTNNSTNASTSSSSKF